MSDHELRRAISTGPFTQLLDDLGTAETVKRVFGNTKQGDYIQELLLRYFSSINCQDISQFGKPSIKQQGLETMKKMNSEMKGWSTEDTAKMDDLVKPLMKGLDFLVDLFGEHDVFRRPAPLQKDGKDQKPQKVFISNNVNPAIFLTMVYCFSRPRVLPQHNNLLENRDLLRFELMTLMQTDPSFTDTMKVTATEKRIKETEKILDGVLGSLELSTSKTPAIPKQTRRDLLAQRASDDQCPLCGELLGPFDDHLHIDHIHPRSKGGTNELSNLQVVHKTCNLRKSNKILKKVARRKKGLF